MLQRVRDLKVQFDNGTLTPTTRTRSRAEVSADRQGNQRASSTDTEFNGTPLLRRDRRFTFQVGANEGETITTAPHDAVAGTAAAGGLSRAHDSADVVGQRRRSPRSTRSTIADDRHDDQERLRRPAATYGAVQNRLEHRLTNLATYQENLTASESRIRDVDMASEMTKFTKLNILQQAGTSMLAQANQAPAGRPLAAALSTARPSPEAGLEAGLRVKALKVARRPIHRVEATRSRLSQPSPTDQTRS